MPSIYREKDLLLKVAEGDTTAFSILFGHYQKKVYFMAWHILRLESDAQDVTQEIFTKLWVHRQKLREVEFFNAYLNTIVQNHVYNCLRRKAIEALFQQEALHRRQEQQNQQQQQYAETPERYELEMQLSQVISNLPPQQRKIFHLGYFKGWKHEEIAGILHISKETVKKHMMAATRKIRNLLNAIDQTVVLLLLWLLLGKK